VTIKSKDFVSSSRGSISARSADITPKWNHISTKSTDITKLYAIDYGMLYLIDYRRKK